jgi:hypothetical protein
MTLMGNSNYLQCFPVGVIKGEKVGEIDIIYVRGKVQTNVYWETLTGLNFLC